MKRLATLTAFLLAACAQQSPAPLEYGFGDKLPPTIISSPYTQSPQAVVVMPTVKNTEPVAPISRNPPPAPANMFRMPPAQTLPEKSVTPARYTVKRGDTLYSIARAHRVDVQEIIRLNNFQSPDALYAEQVISVPGSQQQPTENNYQSPTPETLDVEIDKIVGGNETPAANAQVQYVSHVVKQGDTLSELSQTYGVSILDIMSENELENPRDLRAGQVLRLPMSVAEPIQAREITQAELKRRGLMWPVKGKVVRTFGAVEEGVMHTGINISVPRGTPVVAAERGKVIFADDAVSIFGNLVLLKHPDGLITAYGHNDTLKVKKGQNVQKGQVISLAGQSGRVADSQLHFEVRRNARAVNPLSVLP